MEYERCQLCCDKCPENYLAKIRVNLKKIKAPLSFPSQCLLSHKIMDKSH